MTDAKDDARQATPEADEPSAPPGLWRRYEAVVIDIWLYGLIAVLVTAALAGPVGRSFTGWWWVWFVLYLLVAAYYEVVGIRRFGSTPGKAVMGLRVESATEGPLSPRRLLTRFALGPKVLNMIGLPAAQLLYFICGGRFLHDLVSGSRVVDAKPAGPEFPVASGLWARRVMVAVALAWVVTCLWASPFTRFLAMFTDLGLRADDMPIPTLWAVAAHSLLSQLWAAVAVLGGIVVACLVAWSRPATPAAARAGRAATRMLVVCMALYLLGMMAIGLNAFRVIE